MFLYGFTFMTDLDFSSANDIRQDKARVQLLRFSPKYGSILSTLGNNSSIN